MDYSVSSDRRTDKTFLFTGQNQRKVGNRCRNSGYRSAWIIGVITKFNVLYKEPLEKGTIPKSIVLTAAVIVLCILRCLAEDFIKKKKEEKITKENEKRREN